MTCFMIQARCEIRSQFENFFWRKCNEGNEGVEKNENDWNWKGKNGERKEWKGEQESCKRYSLRYYRNRRRGRRRWRTRETSFPAHQNTWCDGLVFLTEYSLPFSFFISPSLFLSPSSFLSLPLSLFLISLSLSSLFPNRSLTPFS